MLYRKVDDFSRSSMHGKRKKERRKAGREIQREMERKRRRTRERARRIRTNGALKL